MYSTNYQDKNKPSAFQSISQIDQELDKRVVPEKIQRDQRKLKDMNQTVSFGFTLIS